MRGILIVSTCVLAASVQAQENTFNVETDGYFRFGLGLSAQGDRQTCFQLPGARAKYRLGNECESYGEFGATFNFGDPEVGPNYRLRLAASALATPINDYDNVSVFAEEVWVGASRLFPHGPFREAEFWAGHRYYKRQDVHINDFYYWDASGTGFGVTDVALGFAKGSFAVFTNSGGDVETAVERSLYTRVDARFEDISLNAQTDLTVGLDLRFPGDDLVQNDGGGMLTFQIDHTSLRDEELTLALQAGWGAGRDLSFASDPAAADSDRSLRAVAKYLWNHSDDYAVMLTGIAEWQSDAPDWFSVGARQIWRLNPENTYFALETGVDHVVPGAGASRSLAKATAALEWRAGPKFFDRPSFRAYLTLAKWDRGAQAAGIAPALPERDGISVGVQVEQFW